MKKFKSNKKNWVAVYASLAVVCTVIFAGCYNVLYEILEREKNTSGDTETVKNLNGISEFENVKDKDGIVASLFKQEALPNSFKYRIPVMVVFPANAVLPNGQKLGPNGRIYLSGDDRFGNTAYGGGCDLAQKTSSCGMFSDDNGQTWSNLQFVVHFDDLDMSTYRASNVVLGVTAADPTIGRTKDNHLILLSTFGPPKAGTFMGGHCTGWPYFRSNGNVYLWLKQNTDVYEFTNPKSPTLKSSPNVNWGNPSESTTSDNFIYGVPVTGGEIVKVTNKNKSFSAFSDQTVESTGIGLYVDEYYRVWSDKHMTQPYMVRKLKNNGSDDKSGKGSAAGATLCDENKITQAHCFMVMSPYVAFRGCEYTGMSISSDGGVTWTPHKDISYMTRPDIKTNGYWFGSPCGGLLVENGGAYDGRLLFSAYNDTQQTAVFWTEDNGKTWTHSNGFIPQNNGKNTSETSIVDIDGSDDLVAVMRSNAGYPQYAVSSDGGLNWQNLGTAWGAELYPCNNELVSVTRLKKSSSPSGASLYAFSTGSTDGPSSYRWNGRVNIATLEKSGGTWKFNFTWAGAQTAAVLNPGDWFVYSCIREMNNGNLICAWERQECNESHCISYIYLDRE